MSSFSPNSLHFKKFFIDIKKYPFEFCFLFSILLGPAFSYKSIYIFHILFLVFLVLYSKKIIFFFKDLKKWNPKKYAPLYLILFMFIYYSISLLYVSDIILGLKYITCLFFGLSIVIFINIFASNIDKFYTLFRFSTYIVVFEIVIGIIEVFTSFRWPLSRSSFNIEYFGYKLFLTSDILANNDNDYLFSMPSGFMWNPNDFAFLIALIFPFFLFSKNKYVYYIGTFISVFLVISSGAKLCFYSIFILWIFYIFKKGKASRKLFLLLIIASMIFIQYTSNSVLSKKINEISYDLSYVYSSNKIKNNKLTDNNSEQKIIQGRSVNIRKSLLLIGFELFSEKPLFGFGANGAKKELQKVKFELTDMHNFFMEMLINGGIILVLVLGSLFIYLIILLKKISLSNDSSIIYFRNSFIGFCISFIIVSSVPSSLIYILSFYLVFGFLSSYICCVSKE